MPISSSHSSGDGQPAAAGGRFEVRYWPSWLAIEFLALVGKLPFPILFAIGTALGRLAYWVFPGRRHIARRNIELCFPDRTDGERERLIKGHFGYLGVGALTIPATWNISRDRLARLVRLRNRERVDALLAEGRGVVLMVPHYVGMDLAGLAIAAMIRPGCYMYQRIRNPVVDRRIRGARTKYGSKAIERNDDLLAVVRRLRDGELFLYLPDQDAGRRRGIFVPFCGVEAATVAVLPRLVKLTGAAVIPTIPRFLPAGRGLEVEFGEPLAPFPTASREADTTLVNRIIEASLPAQPEQYFWVHRRFKTRPDGAQRIY